MLERRKWNPSTSLKCQAGWHSSGMKTAGRNINNLRHADDTTLMPESKEELKSLLMKVKEDSEKDWTQHSKTEYHGIWSRHFMANRYGKKWKVTDFIFLDSKIPEDSDCSHEIKRCLLLRRKAMTNLDTILKKQRHHFADKGPYS